MNTRSSAPFAGLVTQYRDKLRNDPFLAARLKIAALYFVCGVFIYLGVDFFIDEGLKESFYLVASLPPGAPIDEAFRALKIHLWSGRSLKLVLFALTAYWLAGFAMRPIKRSAELQKRFTATVSHELRTPLAVAKNTAEVALRNQSTLTREKAIGVIKSSLEEMERITDIIQFLLTFSNLEQRTKNFAVELVLLNDVAQRAITLAEKNMQSPRATIQLVVDAPVYVSGSATALEELLLNLVRNALTFTPEGKGIEVHLREDESGKVRLCVMDEGPGIPDSDIPNLFEPFFQGASIPAHETHGIGLGLSIVREIAILHSAEVTVENRAIGGCTFCVLFPAISHEKDYADA